MWNTALIFANKNHGLQKKLFLQFARIHTSSLINIEIKKIKKCRLRKNYWITYCAHMTSHANWIHKIEDVIISIKNINKN